MFIFRGLKEPSTGNAAGLPQAGIAPIKYSAIDGSLIIF
jgi:hypothetical protein